MRRWIPILAFALVACTQSTGNPTAAVTHTPSPAPSAVVSPSVTTDLPLYALPFNCRIPISIPAQPALGALLGVPEGIVYIDPKGAGGLYYDRAFSRWLPVGRDAVSPDGAHYAYAEMGQNSDYFVHIVDVASGKDHAIHEQLSPTGLDAPPGVLDYAPEGIYLDTAFEHLLGGLWLLDPATGSVRQISPSLLPLAITGGFVWTQALNPADPNPIVTGSSAGTLPNEIDRVDLKTGEKTTWLYRPGTGLGLIGFDIGGHPLIDTTHTFIAPDPEAEILIALDPKTDRTIFKGTLAKWLSGAIADEHGIWFGSGQGIYVYSPAFGLQKISNQPGYPANGCTGNID